jgi:phosphohistidine phosphatase SixA
MKKLLIVVIGLVFVSACGKTEKTSTESEIYLVRHFQKQVATEQSGKDVELTQEGRFNAQRLAEHLKNKSITSIYSTNYKRTKQSAHPTSQLLNVQVAEYDPRDLETFAMRLLETQESHLVVGHSNTTGVLFGLLGCETIKLSEDDYGDIMVLTRVHNASASTIKECASYQLGDNKTVVENLVLIKQSDLHQYYIQNNKAFTINDVLASDSSNNGIVEVGFIIDETGNASNFEIVKSYPANSWHPQALNAARQLNFSPTSKRLEKGKSVYTTWVFEFKAN